MSLNVLNRKFLLADDDADDAGLFCEAVTEIAPETECHAVENGLELFELLSKHKEDKPDIIFLDINMPVMNGWDCLKKLKASSAYKSIPVVMYSTSSAQKDIDTAYTMGAFLFLTKPDDFSELSAILGIVACHSQDSLLSQLRGFNSIKTN